MVKTPTSKEVESAVVRVINNPKTKPEDLLAVASAVERHGHQKTADALRARAHKLTSELAGATEPQPVAAPVVSPAPPPLVAAPPIEPGAVASHFVGFPSPWKDVPAPAWTAFVKAMGDKKAKDVDARYRLGIFGLGARRLVDLGIMRSPKKTEWKGQKGVWLGEWVPPHSEEKFLGSPDAQYRAFVASMIAYRKTINQELDGKPAPEPVDGKRVSLSGLLAVAHHAGMGGLGKWLSEERRVPATTAAFTRATEIF